MLHIRLTCQDHTVAIIYTDLIGVRVTYTIVKETVKFSNLLIQSFYFDECYAKFIALTMMAPSIKKQIKKEKIRNTKGLPPTIKSFTKSKTNNR